MARQRQQWLEAREEALRDRLRELPRKKRETFYRRFNEQLADPDTYAALNYLFPAGLHHFYLRRWQRGALNLGVFLAGFGLMATGQVAWGALVIAAVALWELPQLFRAQTLVAEYNLALQERLYQDLDEAKRAHSPRAERLAAVETR